MLKIVEHSAAQRQTQQGEFDEFFVKFLRKEGTDSNGNYRARCVAECAEHVNAVDHSGRSLLHWATIDGDFDAVQFLVAHGANVNLKCGLGNMPLHWVACLWFDRGNHFSQFLVSKGADVNAKNKRGLTPLHFAAFYGRLGTAKFLVSAGAKVNAHNKQYGHLNDSAHTVSSS